MALASASALVLVDDRSFIDLWLQNVDAVCVLPHFRRGPPDAPYLGTIPSFDGGPNPAGTLRWRVAASYADAILNSVGSANGRPRKSMPTGSAALIGPVNRVPPGAPASATRSNASVVNPAGTLIAGKPLAPSSV